MANRLFAVFLLCSFGGVARAQSDAPVALVNGVPISSRTYQSELGSSMRYWEKKNPAGLREAATLESIRAETLETLINRELLSQEAKKRKLEVLPSEVDAGVAEIRARFAVDDSGRKLTPKEAQEAFEAELKTAGKTFEEFRKDLAKQVLMRKLLAAPRLKTEASGGAEAHQRVIADYLDSLRKQAVIFRGDAAASAAKTHEVSVESAKPWWNQ